MHTLSGTTVSDLPCRNGNDSYTSKGADAHCFDYSIFQIQRLYARLWIGRRTSLEKNAIVSRSNGTPRFFPPISNFSGANYPYTHNGILHDFMFHGGQQKMRSLTQKIPLTNARRQKEKPFGLRILFSPAVADLVTCRSSLHAKK